MSNLINGDDAIKAFEEEKQKAKDIRDDFAKFPDSVFEQSIYNEAVKAWKTAIDIVKKLPTVDAVEVVRCTDCKYWNPTHRYCEGIGNWFGEVDSWSDNGFCFKGERRTDG